jgi:hypothetical protein
VQLCLRSPDLTIGGGLPPLGILENCFDISAEFLLDEASCLVNALDSRIAFMGQLRHRSTVPLAYNCQVQADPPIDPPNKTAPDLLERLHDVRGARHEAAAEAQLPMSRPLHLRGRLLRVLRLVSHSRDQDGGDKCHTENDLLLP